MKDRIITKKYLLFICTMVSFTLVLCGIIIACFFSPNSRVIIDTNMFNEAFIEFIMAVIMIPATIWFFCTELEIKY